jgi:hypothetical protein
MRIRAYREAHVCISAARYRAELLLQRTHPSVRAFAHRHQTLRHRGQVSPLSFLFPTATYIHNARVSGSLRSKRRYCRPMERIAAKLSSSLRSSHGTVLAEVYVCTVCLFACTVCMYEVFKWYEVTVLCVDNYTYTYINTYTHICKEAFSAPCTGMRISLWTPACHSSLV